MTILNQWIQRCRERGVKVTPQRTAVFEALLRCEGHPTADSVFEQVRRQHPGVSFATVYNTLQLLTEMGEVREVIAEELRRRYDLNTQPHYHAVCRCCHRIMDIDTHTESLGGERLLQEHDFTVEKTVVEFVGVCGACRRPAVDEFQGTAQPSPLSKAPQGMEAGE